MARAHFKASIGPVGRAPGSPIVVGDEVEGVIVCEPVEAHENVVLEWSIVWRATGRTTDTLELAEGTTNLGRVVPGTPSVTRFRARIPADGPISYRGQLFSGDWVLQVNLDIPWAFDPSGEWIFSVVPLVESVLRIAPANQPGEKCPFCKDLVGRDERRSCPTCNTAHHRECFELYGGCSVFGCSQRGEN